MPDTERELSEILSAHADNTHGDITPQDARDAFVSLAPAVGSVGVVTPAATTIAGAGTMALGAGTGALSSVARGVDCPSGLRARYIGEAARLAVVRASVVLSSATAGPCELGARLYHNGSPVGMTARGGIVDDNGYLTLYLAHTLEVAQNDYFEVYVTNYTDTGVVTITAMHLSIEGHIL